MGKRLLCLYTENSRTRNPPLEPHGQEFDGGPSTFSCQISTVPCGGLLTWSNNCQSRSELLRQEEHQRDP